MSRPLSRRGLFKVGGAAAASLAVAGCGIPGLAKIISPAQAKAEGAAYWPKQKPTGKLNFANWADYIDPSHETLKLFTKATGIQVNYQEVIEDDNSFFAKIDPLNRAGEYSGFDLMVITDGFEFNDLVELGEVIPLDGQQAGATRELDRARTHRYSLTAQKPRVSAPGAGTITPASRCPGARHRRWRG